MRSTSRYSSCHFQIRTNTVSASDFTQYTHKYIQMHTQTGTQTNIDIKVPPGPTLTQRNHRHTDPVTIPQSHNSAHSYWPSKTQQGTVAQRGDTAPTLLPGALLHLFLLFSYTLPSQALPVCFTSSSRKFITFSLRTAF